MAKYSLIIKNGTVFDGKGNKPKRIDIGVVEDRIKTIGNLGKHSAEKIIDASGKYVSPGFIDITSHSDTNWTLFAIPGQESLVTQGVTTIIGGSCGTSLAPFIGEFSKKEIGKRIDISQVNINWQTMGEFLDEVEKHKIGVNFGSFVGLNTIISSLASKEDLLEKVKFLTENSIKEGAIGVSFNFGVSSPVALNEDEIFDLFKFLGKKNIVTKHHLRDEGKDILPAVSEIIGIARKTKARIHISHFRAIGRGSWEFIVPALQMIKTAREEGLNISCDFFPYTRTGSGLLELLPQWTRKFPAEELKEIFAAKNKDSRLDDIKEYFKMITLHYDKMIIASAAKEYGLTGKTIKQLADDAEKTGEEIIIEILRANDMRVSIFNDVISEENIMSIAKNNFSVLSSCGAGYDIASKIKNKNNFPHPRSFGTFTKSFDMFVRGTKILSWEEAIRKMTGLPAEIIGLANRGLIKKGHKADLVVFDPNIVSGMSGYEDPFKYSIGVEHVFVNGKAVVSDGKPTGTLSGKVLRKRI